MLSVTEEMLLMRAIQSLREPPNVANRAKRTALADELEAHILANTRLRQAISEQRSAGARHTRGGRPTTFYAIETEPGGLALASGMHATVAALEQQLRALGSKRLVPTSTSLAATLSRKGYWHLLVDTDNGTVSLTVRRATGPEIERITGTDLAPRKDRAKNPKSP